MANYNLYNNIEPSQIKSATSSLRNDVNSSKSKLSSFQSSLSDGIWKATAKNTLFKAFTTINDDVVPKILSSLDNADSVADNIKDYKEARDKAKEYKSDLDSERAKPDETRSSSRIHELENKISAEEAKMDAAEKAVNSLV